MYSCYIFDLYGTLLRIVTDEKDPRFWKHMCGIYAVYGADYQPEEMRETYLAICHEEEEKIRTAAVQYPEIDLETVFYRLWKEAPHRHSPYEQTDGGREWIFAIASFFRVLSRKEMDVYPGTAAVLEKLKADQKKIYLLTNAQYLFTGPELEVTGLCDYPDEIYISSDYGMKKPQKEFMARLLEEENIPAAAAVMIGNDMASDIRIAMENGVDSIFLNTDGYSEEQIEAQIHDICKDGYRPKVIQSGDIAEILKQENGYA